MDATSSDVSTSDFVPPSPETGTATPPFQFTLEGTLTFSPSIGTREGVRIFISRFVDEWLVWYRAGCLDLSLCDLAAFRTAFIHCHYLGETTQKDIRDWLGDVFGIPAKLNFMEFRHEEISATTLGFLRRLGPAMLASSGRPKRGEISGKVFSRELLIMACPVEHFLIQGGDQRLTLNPGTLLNGYGCRPFPRPEAVTFSSSTATSISAYAFALVEKRRQTLIAAAIRIGILAAARQFADAVRRAIGKELGVPPQKAEAVLSSSGTDSFLVTQGVLRLISDSPLVTLMVGADESGTGVPLAAQERHFAVRAALGPLVVKGQPLGGCASDGDFIEVLLHNGKGKTVPPKLVDQHVRKLAEEKLAAGFQVVIHAMNHSKLGRMGPSPSLLVKLKERFGARLHVVIDACQMRLDLDELRLYLDHGFLVIITGSKFFTGPPLSGAVLIPRRLVKRLLAVTRHLPESFNAYCATLDLPPDLRKILTRPGSSFNLGSYFRWVAATAEMKRYFRVPALLRKKALDDFCRKVEERFFSRAGIELQYEKSPARTKHPGSPRELSDRRMIFPFFLMSGRGTKQPCGVDRVRMIYTLLNQDCSGQFASANAREYRLLAQRCHIGQPVVVRHRSGQMSAVLRLSVGARVISESWSESSGRIEPDLINDEIWQVSVVLDKIELLLGKIPVARS